jgi:hypothetical protein
MATSTTTAPSEIAMTGARRPGPKRSLSDPTRSAATTPADEKMALFAIAEDTTACPVAFDSS